MPTEQNQKHNLAMLGVLVAVVSTAYIPKYNQVFFDYINLNLSIVSLL